MLWNRHLWRELVAYGDTRYPSSTLPQASDPRLSLFGSALREDIGPTSDVDVLVEFEPGHIPGLAFFSMEEELSQIIGRKADLNTSGFLSP
jgi:predicted nucleotidyltransferase